jgi:hypothetical protein
LAALTGVKKALIQQLLQKKIETKADQDNAVATISIAARARNTLASGQNRP